MTLDTDIHELHKLCAQPVVLVSELAVRTKTHWALNDNIHPNSGSNLLSADSCVTSQE